jgi:hypothetical protein
VSPDDIRELLADEPFTPFRLHLTDGSRYDVRHRDALVLGQTKLILGLPSDHASWERPYDRFAHITLLHINRIEPITVKKKGRNHRS